MRIVASLALLLCACTQGSVRLELANQTVTAAPHQALLADGTSLRLRMIAVYLAEDIDPVTQNNAGTTSMIWLNPQCDGDISDCNIAGFTKPDGPRVTDYFDLSRPTEEINAELRSQDTGIDLGTYRYARIELCKAYGDEHMPTEPALLWQGPGMAAEQRLISGDCGRTSLPFDPPLEIGANDVVDVELGYDLAQAIVSGRPSSSPCSNALEGDARCFRECVNTSADSRVCMDFPDFAPTATKR